MNTCIDPLSLLRACINYTFYKNKVFLHAHTYHFMKNILEQESLYAKNGGLSTLYDTGFSDPCFCGTFLDAMAVPHCICLAVERI